MLLLNKFSLNRVQTSKTAVTSVFDTQEDDALAALLKLTLEPSNLNTNATEQSYSVIEGEPIAGPFVDPRSDADAFDTVDGSEGNDVFGFPPAGSLIGSTEPTNANATEQSYSVIEGEPIAGPFVDPRSDAEAFDTVDGSEGNDVFGPPPSPGSPEVGPTDPVICWEGMYDPMETVREEYAAALSDGSDAAMKLFLARHPGVEVSTELGVISYDLSVTMPNGQNEWLALS